MSKAKIDIGTEVSAALIEEGVKTQGLHNSIRPFKQQKQQFGLAKIPLREFYILKLS